MELLEYIEKCREVKETGGWPEEEKNMALRNEILVGLKTLLGYQKGLGEHQNMLATERVIEIATDIYNSDCQKSIPQKSRPYSNDQVKFRSCTQTNKTTRKLLKDKTEKEDTSRRKEERNREEVSDKIV